MDKRRALLVDYEFCLGCKECEIACMNSHDFGKDCSGIKVATIGPMRAIGGKWQYDFIPLPTDYCDLCSDSGDPEHMPACIRSCEYCVIKIGALSDFEYSLNSKAKQLVFIR